MKLYHGSNLQINNIDLACSHRGKDFGCGFYLSNDYEQAYRMACLTTERIEKGMPEVTTYEFDEQILTSEDIHIKQFNGYTEEWAEFVLDNRRNPSRQNVHPYDIVIGPIANDKVGVQIRRFLLGDITVKQLVDELRYRKGITYQYFFATERAVKYLKKQ